MDWWDEKRGRRWSRRSLPVALQPLKASAIILRTLNYDSQSSAIELGQVCGRAGEGKSGNLNFSVSSCANATNQDGKA